MYWHQMTSFPFELLKTFPIVLNFDGHVSFVLLLPLSVLAHVKKHWLSSPSHHSYFFSLLFPC